MFENILFIGVAEVSERVQSFIGGRGGGHNGQGGNDELISSMGDPCDPCDSFGPCDPFDPCDPCNPCKSLLVMKWWWCHNEYPSSMILSLAVFPNTVQRCPC